MMKWIIGISTSLLLVFLLGITLLITPIGTKVSFTILEKIIPGKFHYEKVSGVLIGPLNLTNVTYHYKNISISAAKLHVQWQPSKLMIGEIVIKDLIADQIKLTLPQQKKKFHLKLPQLNLPGTLLLDNAVLTDIKIGNKPKQYPIQIKLVTMHGKITNSELTTQLTTHFVQPYNVNINLDLSGSPSDYKFKILADSKDIHWLINGTGSKQWLQLVTNQAHTLNGSLNGKIKLQWNSRWQWRANINAKQLNLQKFNSHWPKQVSIQLKTQGSYKKYHPNFYLQTTLQTPQAHIHISGTHENQWNLNWKADINQLSSLIANYQGSIHGSGKIVGSFHKPVISGQLEGEKLALLNYQIDKLQALWNVDLGYHNKSTIQLNAKKIRTPHIQLSDFKVLATGQPRIHQLKALITLDNSKLGMTHINMLVDGKLMKGIWKGQLKQFDINSNRLGKWTLDQAGLIDVSPQKITFTELCWHANKDEACIRGDFNKADLAITSQLMLSKKGRIAANINLPHFKPLTKLSSAQPIKGNITINIHHLKFLTTLFPEIINPKGSIVGKLTLGGTIGNPSASGSVELKNGSIEIPELNLTLTKIAIDINATNYVLHYKLQAFSQNQLIQLNGTTQMNLPGKPTQLTIQGENILIINTQEYEIYISPLLKADIKGNKINVTGTINIPTALLRPTDFKSAVTLPEDVIFVGPGSKKTSRWATTLHVKITIGNNVIVDTHGFDGRLGGQLTIAKTPTHTYTATGKVAVTNATFTARGNIFTISPDSNVTYTDSPLDNPNLSIKASRIIKLAPSEGTQFGTLRNLVVGLDIQGTLKQPNVSLFSIPSNLSQADILSYLIFGHPANVNTPGNISLLLQAVDTLNLGGGKTTPGGITDKISQGLGLSEFGIESGSELNLLGTQQESAFVIGRYIAPNIYVRYSRGLVIPVNIVEVRYLIGQHWAIQTNSSSLGTGGDILYTIQTN